MITTATKPDAVPDERTARTPPSCRGSCNQGRQACDCKTFVGMWDDEMRSPRRAALLYLGTLFGSILLSHCMATGGGA